MQHTVGPLIDRTKNCITEMCSRMAVTLKDNNKDPKSFQLQIIAIKIIMHQLIKF